MKAARLHGAGDIRVGEEPVPEPGPGMCLVRVTAVGICGSDLHWWDEGNIGDTPLTAPMVLGHEAAGVIEDGPRRGERVVLGGIPASDQIAFGASAARRKGLTIAMARRMNEVYPRAIGLAAGGQVELDPLVTGRFDLAGAPDAMAAAAARTGLKIIVEPSA
jgi:threonine dehydrogenase-like Zn-dependent dehydrogenase